MRNLLLKKLSQVGSLVMTGVITAWMIIPTQIASAADTYHYRWVGQTPAQITADGKAHYVTANQGDTVAMSVTLQNMSNTTIRNKTSLGTVPAGKQVPVGSYAIGVRGDAQTPWLDASSFVLNGNRMAYYDGLDVAPNAQFTISWNVKIANSASNGTYDLYFRPVYEYQSWTAQIAWNGKLLAFDSADIFTRFIIGGGSLSTYSPQGTDFVFDYPSSWQIASEEFPTTGSYVVLLNLNNPTLSWSGDYPISVSLTKQAGTSIDSAISNFIAGLSSSWGEPIISSLMKTTRGRDYKYVAIRNGDAEINRYFVINEHNFVVQVEYGSSGQQATAQIIVNSIR